MHTTIQKTNMELTYFAFIVRKRVTPDILFSVMCCRTEGTPSMSRGFIAKHLNIHILCKGTDKVFIIPTYVSDDSHDCTAILRPGAFKVGIEPCFHNVGYTRSAVASYVAANLQSDVAQRSPPTVKPHENVSLL